jgi:hypothetical protein
MDQGGKMFDPTVIETIMLGALGLTVLGVTEMIKKWFKASGVLAYAISMAVSAAGTAYYLIQANSFTILSMIGYTFFVFLSANGIYKATRGPYA